MVTWATNSLTGNSLTKFTSFFRRDCFVRAFPGQLSCDSPSSTPGDGHAVTLILVTLEPLQCHAREEPHQQEQPLREVQSDAEWADQTRLGGLSEGATAARWPSFPQVHGGEAKRPARIAYEATPWSYIGTGKVKLWQRERSEHWASYKCTECVTTGPRGDPGRTPP
ncbi:hypothetical protein PGT21_000678 [Puccinia graminis f. sp. tritici]|uniref:Uncharacterized protein n=1 Tax=Puccinia graminis f. sp. tritici TaxID=56615 RepID=A0A5B0LU01_PUCGR|nr:hypothetical protein PGT21_000678 [Puccinia graminis f. sp. tritici]KAA1132934.1 hypothetical protein PGTUg99_001337 [Puccinia graminis f. sp. tritici]